MAEHREEDHEEQSISERILAAMRKGTNVLTNLTSGSLKEGEVPSGADFSRTQEEQITAPQGFFDYLNRSSQLQAGDRVNEFNQREASEDSAADRLLKLGQANSANSLAVNRGAKLDFAREKHIIDGLESIEELERKRAELKLERDKFTAAQDPESIKNLIALNEVINGRITALTGQRGVIIEEKKLPGELKGINADTAQTLVETDDITENRDSVNAGIEVDAEGNAINRITAESNADLNVIKGVDIPKARDTANAAVDVQGRFAGIGEEQLKINQQNANQALLGITGDNSEEDRQFKLEVVKFLHETGLDFDPGWLERNFGSPTALEDAGRDVLDQTIQATQTDTGVVPGSLGEAPDALIDELLLKHNQDPEAAKAEAREMGYLVP